jgi:predicted dithiol-disulfide oxidoreductase (DUF899 family)
MFGESYEAACLGSMGLADHLDASLPHLNYRDVTLMAISRAPVQKQSAKLSNWGAGDVEMGC